MTTTFLLKIYIEKKKVSKKINIPPSYSTVMNILKPLKSQKMWGWEPSRRKTKVRCYYVCTCDLLFNYYLFIYYNRYLPYYYLCM